MIKVGELNTLMVARATSVGIYLEDDEGNDVLVPTNECPKEYKVNEPLTVFVYRDSEDRIIATSKEPKIKLHEFALLKVNQVSSIGAFMDWGLLKDLLVPFKEQRQNMEKDRWYVVRLALDEKTDRLYASNKLGKWLQNEELSVSEKDEVSIIVTQKTDLGFNVIINNAHTGLIFNSDIFGTLNIGDKKTGYIKQIRDDNKIDVSLQPIDFKKFNDKNTETVYSNLIANNGTLDLNDKTDPEKIYALLGMSKKAFKRAIGNLYKSKKIEITDTGILLKK